MDNNIRITTADVANTASQMRVLNNNLDEILNTITNDMNSLSSVWESSGAEALASKFKKFASRFVLESETIEDYCKFLDLTSQTYDSLETTITANANSFE